MDEASGTNKSALELLPLSHRVRARQRLARLLENEALDIVEAALLVAAEEYPDLDVDRELGRIRLIAAEGARRVHTLSNPFARLDGLRVYLYEELGFKGNTDEYSDPRNCFLNQVLDRRLGIPLTLSILFNEVANSSGFEAFGVALPGHFVSRVHDDGRDILVDTFHGGEVITEEDCKQLVARTTGRPSLFRREMLSGSDERGMLARLLLNVKHMYVERGEYARALAAVERLLMLKPGDAKEVRDRGFLQARMGRTDAAIVDLEAYLTHSPDAPDKDSVQGRVAWLKRRQAELN